MRRRMGYRKEVKIQRDVIACDKRKAFAQGSEATNQSIGPRGKYGLLRCARNDGVGAVVATTTSNAKIPSALLPGHHGIHQIRYCLVMISPSLELSAMNSWMNSCTPCWKISSIWLCSRRLRTPRAWRWAAPWRP